MISFDNILKKKGEKAQRKRDPQELKNSRCGWRSATRKLCTSHAPRSPPVFVQSGRRLAPGENQPEQTATEILTLFEISADVDIGNGALEFHYGNSDGSVGLRLIYVVIVFKQVPVIDVGSGLPGTALFMVL